MPVLNIQYKDYNLQLVFPYNSYYATKEFEPGKTIYQILFERLIDGNVVSPFGLAKRYKKVNPLIGGKVIISLMRRIEAALRTAKDERLREMRFTKKEKGLAALQMREQRAYVRYNKARMEIINAAIRELYGQGGIPANRVVRDVPACKPCVKRDWLKRLFYPLAHYAYL
ncbi:MAG: hypothetical protein Q8N60_04465 [Candidatus Diapherotrites archaeon]|nr:hypothetical protein [Candidatus Diapherotrites archaeon]